MRPHFSFFAKLHKEASFQSLKIEKIGWNCFRARNAKFANLVRSEAVIATFFLQGARNFATFALSVLTASEYFQGSESWSSSFTFYFSSLLSVLCHFSPTPLCSKEGSSCFPAPLEGSEREKFYFGQLGFRWNFARQSHHFYFPSSSCFS